MSVERSSSSVIAMTGLVAAALGVTMGVIWWWVAPTEQWVVVEGGLAPADPGYTGWFSADGWFLVLGAVAGVLLTAITWQRGRGRPVALVAGVVVGAGLVSLVAWAIGGFLGAPDPQTVAETAEAGTTVAGSLGIRATAVLLAPALTALTILALMLASARIDDDGAESRHDVGVGVPQQTW